MTYKEIVTSEHITAAQTRANAKYSSSANQFQAYERYRNEMELFNNAVRYNDIYVDLTPRQQIDDKEFKELCFYFACRNWGIVQVHQYLRDLVGTKHHE